MKIIADNDKCDGCKICEQICTFFHYQEFNPKRSRIKVVQHIREGMSMPKTCNQCRECIEVCSEGALYWNNALGTVCLDEKKCTGCEVCVQSCSQGVLSKDPISGFINICDFCGGEPQCVGWCPEKALQLQ